ncbi:MAG: Ig-like domain-containing protein [Candidatus Nanoarchaeia archaeon]|nr:Ig-like domain-containing protein [Candidatus Nanoarchaeia archaeon]
MVHKRYVKRGNKVYGPYLYNSKRVNGKVKNEYLGIDKSGEWRKAGILASVFILVLIGIALADYGIFSGSSSGITSSLIVWDQGSGGIDNSSWFSNCSSYTYTHCDSGKSASHATVLFYANYSNSTVGPIMGNCSIRFNYTGTYGSFSEMNYNPLTFLYEFNSSFNIRSNYSTQFMVQINCTNISSDTSIRYDNLSAVDYFEIKNTKPYNILPYDSTIPIQTCNEDTACTYNVSANFTDDDDNDLPLSSFSINSTSSTFSTCTLSVSNLGIITVLCTNSSQAGSYNAFVTATDGAGSSSASLTIPYTITAVNDAPIVTGLTQTCTEDTLCSFYISASDEESGTITNGAGTGLGYLNFTSNSTLVAINLSNGSVSFTPLNADVGTHYIEINVTDADNERNTTVLVLTINNDNDPPNLFYACNSTNNTILTEDVIFSCMLNATDEDEGDTHTYTANYSWFTISCGTQTVSSGNTSCNVTFAPTDIAVFSHWINITVTDSGGLKSSKIINFSVDNVPDYPYWKNITNVTAWANVSYWNQVEADDNDTLTQFGDWVNYSANYTWFNINASTGIIVFDSTGLNDKTGTWWVNITANDSTGLEASVVINFTVYANSYPHINIVQEYNLTEGYEFYLNISANVTADTGETITYADNTSLFDINATTGEINFTPTDINVGTNWVQINITDNRGTTNTSIFNFTVYNEEDAPVLETIPNLTNVSEGTAFIFYVNFTDDDLKIPSSTESVHVKSNSTALFTLDLYVTQANATNSTSGKVILPITFTPSATSNGTYWINITLNDSTGLGTSQLVLINVSEYNVPPMFMTEDPAFCSVREAEEDTLFASCTLIACDNDTSTTLSFAANYSWFAMNNSAITAVLISPNVYCANVTVNFTPDYTEVGNWSILLNVTDNMAAYDTYEITFNISSVNDAPVLDPIPDLFVVYDVVFTYDINATDEEGNTLTFSYNGTALYDSAIGGWLSLNTSTGMITIDADSLDADTYKVNFTVNDTHGASDSQVVNITIRENTKPYCTTAINNYRSLTKSDNTEIPKNTVFFPTDSVNFSMRESEITGNFTISCTDDEGDAITFEWYWNTTLNRTYTTSGTPGAKSDTWGYTTYYLDAGNYTMSLVVKDTGQNKTYNITVSVANVNAPPMLVSQIPNISKLPSGNGWYNDVVNSRNFSVYFIDLDGENLTYSGYWLPLNESFSDSNITRIISAWETNGNWNITNDTGNPAIRQNSTSGIAYANISGLSYTNLTGFSARIKLMGTGAAGLCFASEGGCLKDSQLAFFNSTDNKTYIAKYDNGTESYLSSTYSLDISLNESYWIKTKVKDNNTLLYVSLNSTNWNLAYNVSFNETATGNLQLITISGDAVFDDINVKDPDLRNMTLAVVSGGNITMTPASGWFGEITMILAASDGINTTDSNQFTLHVDEVTVLPPVTLTTTTTSTSTRMETKAADMTILVPSMISLTPLSKTIVPVILKNTGQLDLNTITLIATSNQSELKLNLNETSWTALTIGDSVYVNLEVDIGLLAPDRYTIRLDAESQIPPLKRFAEIVVDVREKDAVLKAQLKEMIQFTRDLFLQNPECLELTELINEAEEKFRTYQYEEGLEMIHRANQGCKEFIAAKEGESNVNLAGMAKTFIQEHWKTMILEGIGLILAILLLIYYFQRRSAAKL